MATDDFLKNMWRGAKKKYEQWKLDEPVREAKRENRRLKTIERERNDIELLKLKAEKERTLAKLEVAKTDKIKAQSKRPSTGFDSFLPTQKQSGDTFSPKLDMGFNLPKAKKKKGGGLFEGL